MGNTNSTSNNNRPPNGNSLNGDARDRDASRHNRHSRSTAPTASPAPTNRTSATASPLPSTPSASSPVDANGPSTHAVPIIVNSPTKDPSVRDREVRERDKDKDKKQPHRSLRTKKKSLELPDLALALTPASSPGHVGPPGSHMQQGGPYRRPQPSSPIAIPARQGALPSGSGPAANYQRSTANPGATVPAKPNLTAAQEKERQRLGAVPVDALVQGPAGSTPAARRGNPHIRGAPLQYNSTRSFQNTRAQIQQGRDGRDQQRNHPLNQSSPHRNHFQPEDVQSSLPLALHKAEVVQPVDPFDAEDTVLGEGNATVKRHSTELKQPEPVKIVFSDKVEAKVVELIMAADENWKHKTSMDYDETDGVWRKPVIVMPGTHHIRFIVDGVTRTSNNLPTAVDDQGSLANYVASSISGPPVSSTATTPAATEQPPPSHNTMSISTAVGASFFADSEDPKNIAPEAGEWTDQVPWQLECAAEEEEAWLTTGQAARSQPPQHPQAPILPRHLEKLIMNQRPPGMGRTHGLGGPGSSSSGASSSGKSNAAVLGLFNRNGGALPVTTASGTNLSATSSGQNSASESSQPLAVQPLPLYTKLGDVAGQLADDGSVLPVPSHVVLHHLGTSAIRNGVLAVADTIRYKKKYTTTIYYKPT